MTNCEKKVSESDLLDKLIVFYGRFEQSPFPLYSTAIPHPGGGGEGHIQKIQQEESSGPSCFLPLCSSASAYIHPRVQHVPPPAYSSTVFQRLTHNPCANIPGLGDYRPVALTSVMMKAFRCVVLSHLKSQTSPLSDNYQFAFVLIGPLRVLSTRHSVPDYST